MPDSNLVTKAGRWLWRLALIPHRTTETLIRIRGLATTLESLSDSFTNHIASERAEAPRSLPPPVDELQIYRGYSDADVDLLRRYAAKATPVHGVKSFIVDFLGTRSRVSIMHGLERLDGTVRDLPIPTDGWHAEAVEWVGLLKSVDQAENSFTAMELGAGWGPWVVAGARAAQLRGISNMQLCAVEADPTHFSYLVDHFLDNGLDPTRHELIAAAVGVTAGTARWPKVPDPSGDWGSRPRLADEEGNTDHIGRKFEEWLDVRIIPFRELLQKKPVWDLVHIDVQGWEVELCTAEAAQLDSRVKWLVVGTHDYKLHGDLINLMYRRGWRLENEKPPRSVWTQGAPSLVAMTWVDGTQVWQNPAFSAPMARRAG